MTKQKRLFPVSSWSGAIGSRNGFTLMELLVYMIIVGIIVVIAGQAFSNSTKFRVRTQNMLAATQVAENVASLFRADVSQMGAKSSKEDGDAVVESEKYGDVFSNIHTGVYMKPAAAGVDEDKVDYSSFLLTTSNGFSDLTFRRVRYTSDGYYDAIDEIRWFVQDSTLYRSCYTYAGNELKETSGDDEIYVCKKKESAADDPVEDAVEIASHVKSFTVTAPNPVTAADEQIFPTPGDDFRLIPRTGEDHYFGLVAANEPGVDKGAGTEIAISQFYTNYDNAEGQLKQELNNMNQLIAVNAEDYDGDSWKDYCQNRGRIPLLKNHTYEISFEIPFTSLSHDFDVQPFVPGEDHMSVGFRGMNWGKEVTDGSGRKLLEDFLFFPPYNANGSGKRYMRFTVPASMDTVCLAFTFACYSPKAFQAKLVIKNLAIKEVAGLNYDFSTAYDPEAHKNDKKNIKALKMQLKIGRGGKNGENGETGDVEIVVPTPSNGPRD